MRCIIGKHTLGTIFVWMFSKLLDTGLYILCSLVQFYDIQMILGDILSWRVWYFVNCWIRDIIFWGFIHHSHSHDPITDFIDVIRLLSFDIPLYIESYYAASRQMVYTSITGAHNICRQAQCRVSSYYISYHEMDRLYRYIIYSLSFKILNDISNILPRPVLKTHGWSGNLNDTYPKQYTKIMKLFHGDWIEK